VSNQQATDVPAPTSVVSKALAWFLNPYVQIGLGSLTVTASELLMKKGASATANGGIGWFGVAALGSGWTWIGIVCYLLSFISWIHVLRYIPLGTAYALINVVHVLIPLGAWVFLHEPVNAQRWIGIAIVVGGLLLVIKPATAAEEKL
jgi:drug/metabolite transporter (DMT)-like permease